ncbi:PD-(D/E)XK nuclease family protein [Geobacter sp. DSM 9736]|uniref:PD-(D/E)XK nuclease family protein n=1 Tax=Geobacter sp. DSM 9736 TaxID=1277350 RepID=UPI000B50B9CB|nr:PD-(D/E)XK nuclease family protein [Geobacter sp. DSM 9736]SNB47455.1 ATP-dependent helicase/DNAse subunit B [Geobacter sp. DSM 9736]
MERLPPDCASAIIARTMLDLTQPNSRRTLLIVPSQAAAERCTREALATHTILCGPAALTLRGLCDSINRVSGACGIMLSGIGMKMLLEDLVRRRYSVPEEGPGRPGHSPGFIDALASAISELKQANFTAADLVTHLPRLPRTERMTYLASLYGQYERTLAERGLIDAHDGEIMALRHLRDGGTLPGLFTDLDSIVVDGIYDLTAGQLSLLAELSRRLPVELRLPYSPEREGVYACAARTADAVESLDNSDLNLALTFEEPHGRFVTPLLAAVHDDMPALETEAPGLIAAPGPYRECEEIGRRIRRLMEGGADPSGIAVCFRTLEMYEEMMEDVCRRFSIPVSYRRGAPLATAALVRAALSPLVALKSDISREELAGLCGSSYLSFQEEPRAGEVEQVLSGSGYINDSLGTAEEKIGRLIARFKTKGKDSSREERVRRMLVPLLTDIRAFRGSRTVADFTLLLERFIKKYHIFERGISSTDRRILKRDASAIALLQQLLKDVARDAAVVGTADRAVTSGEYLELLREGMEGVCLSGERSSGVSILNFRDARGLSFPHLFVGGLNEGVCPAPHQGHALLKDSDKLLLRRLAGTRWLRTAREKGEEEPLLFWLAVSCATESLTFSYCYADSRGNQLLPSPYLEEILDKIQLREERSSVTNLTPEPEECMEPEELLNSLALRRLLEPSRLPAEMLPAAARINANAEVEAERELFFSASDRRTRDFTAGPRTGRLAGPAAVEELASYYSSPEGRCFTPTSLEEYATCPFRYFMRRLLRVDVQEKPDIELETRDVGSLAHLVLKEFFLRMQREERLPLRDLQEALRILHEVASGAFRWWEENRHTGESLLWEMEKESLLPLLERLVELEVATESPFIPYAFEHKIDPPLQVADETGESILLCGQIDRIDIDKSRQCVKVVDYKVSGNGDKFRTLLKKSSLGDTSFQIPVYLLAAAQLLETEGVGKPSDFAACYWLLRKSAVLEKKFRGDEKEDFTGFLDTDPGIRRTLGTDNFLNRLCAIVRRIRGGDFQVTPAECGYCDFSSVCRYVPVNLKDDQGVSTGSNA